ncbi:MAG: hypothetical protein LUH02_11780 [Erysipelotrichaceae bacterium]|nr:hypothetical protein [Erysipelotrichaceae bacterium]
MQRGYTFVNKDDKMIKSVKELEKNDDITIRFYDGTIEARVK